MAQTISGEVAMSPYMKKVISDKKTTLTHDFIVDHEYEVVVRAIGPDGTQQAMESSVRETIVIKGKEAAPTTPTALSAAGFLESVTLNWTNPLNYDFGQMEIWRSTTNNIATAAKIAEVRGITYIDAVGTSGTTLYYWIRAVNTSGIKSDYSPRTTAGVPATTLGITATDIDDFSVTATKMFTKSIILSGDAWTNNDPGAGSIAWNTHNIVYNGVEYPITASNTSSAYVYWVIGDTLYSSSASHPALGTTAFMVAINTSGVHTLVWNSSANMVIGSAYIADLAVDKLTANAAYTGEIISNTAQIKDAIINDAKITGTITVGKTDAKCTDALADQTSVNTAADIAGQGALATLNEVETAQLGSTVIVGGYIKTGLVSCDNINTGTLTGRKIQTAVVGGAQAILDNADNTFRLYNSAGVNVLTLDDDGSAFGGLTPRIHLAQDDYGGEILISRDSGGSFIHMMLTALPCISLAEAAYSGNFVQVKNRLDASGASHLYSGVNHSNAEVFYVTDTGNIGVAGTVDGVDVAVLKSDFDTHDGGTGSVHGDATTNVHGFMTDTQFDKLAGIATSADVTGSNAPQAHGTSHQNGGGDEISVLNLSGLLADGQTPLAHKTSHQNGGGDEISVAGLSGELADDQPPKAHSAAKITSGDLDSGGYVKATGSFRIGSRTGMTGTIPQNHDLRVEGGIIWGSVAP